MGKYKYAVISSDHKYIFGLSDRKKISPFDTIEMISDYFQSIDLDIDYDTIRDMIIRSSDDIGELIYPIQNIGDYRKVAISQNKDETINIHFKVRVYDSIEQCKWKKVQFVSVPLEEAASNIMCYHPSIDRVINAYTLLRILDSRYSIDYDRISTIDMDNFPKEYVYVKLHDTTIILKPIKYYVYDDVLSTLIGKVKSLCRLDPDFDLKDFSKIVRNMDPDDVYVSPINNSAITSVITEFDNTRDRIIAILKIQNDDCRYGKNNHALIVGKITLNEIISRYDQVEFDKKLFEHIVRWYRRK